MAYPFWHSQACELKPDPVSGARITRLTGAALHCINIYFEQPHATPDGSRIACLRAASADPRIPPSELCVVDLDTLRMAVVEPDIACSWIATASWSGFMHYLRSSGELIRLDLATLEKQIVMTWWPLPDQATLWSATPDLRYVIAAYVDHEFHCNLVRIDARDRSWETIYRHRWLHNHVQVHPVTGRDVLLQRNRGLRTNHLRQRRDEEVEHRGATHVLIDIDGGSERELAIGEPWTAPTTGHATWVGDTGRIATPVHWPGQSMNFDGQADRPAHDPRHPQGNHMLVGPGDEKPRVFPAPEHLFVHAGASRCGRYFVAESVRYGIPGPVEIVVGCFATGRHAVLVQDCGASCGGPAVGHAHAYLTADNRRVIYNSDATGLAQVHMAELPGGFLDALG